MTCCSGWWRMGSCMSGSASFPKPSALESTSPPTTTTSTTWGKRSLQSHQKLARYVHCWHLFLQVLQAFEKKPCLLKGNFDAAVNYVPACFLWPNFEWVTSSHMDQDLIPLLKVHARLAFKVSRITKWFCSNSHILSAFIARTVKLDKCIKIKNGKWEILPCFG